MTRLAADVLLGGRYRLADLIAVGGMGEVWRGTDEVLHRQVAVKVLKQEYVDEPGFLERFRAEARHAGGLSHPGIATVFDYGEDGGTSYLVMELVDGEPLSSLLAREGRLPAARALSIVADTAGALHAAHTAGVIHRDVKPGNILLPAGGSVKVTDFGIARAVDAVPVTQTGTLLGTAHYLSPEQAAGQRVGPTSDVYSLGVVLFECVAGHRPFEEGNAVAIAMAHLGTPAPDLPADVPPAVQEIVRTALAKDPADRFRSAADFAAAAAAAGTVVGSRDAPTAVLHGAPAAVPATAVLRAEPTTAPRADRRWRWVVPSAVALLLLVALVLALGGDRDGTPGRPGPTSTRRAAPSASATTVGVPADLVGKSREDAAAAVRKAGLDPRVESRAHAASPGTVVEVRPTAGARLQRGDEVTLVVSSGSDRTDGGVGTEDGKDEEKDDDKGKGKGDDKKKDG